MLYLIGGPPRMGKSSMAQMLLQNLSIPYVSTDALTVMLKPMGEPLFYGTEKAARFYPMMDEFISRMLKVCPDYAIEGDAFTPHHVDALREKYDLRAVFLIMSEVSTDNIIKYAKYDNWASDDSAEQLENLATRIKESSGDIKNECEHYGIPYFDVSTDYTTNIESAYAALVGGASNTSG